MISFMQFLEALERTIIVQRIGPTPSNIDAAGGFSAWFWDSVDGQNPSGELKVSYPIERLEKLQRDKDWQFVRLYCKHGKVYATRLPFMVVNNLEDKLNKIAVANARAAGPQKVGQARIDQTRQVG